MAPTGSPAWPTDHLNGDHYVGGSSTPAAVAGYPNITVPAGFIEGLPVGLSFMGRAWSEAALIRLAYDYEQITQHRQPPRFVNTLSKDGRRIRDRGQGTKDKGDRVRAVLVPLSFVPCPSSLSFVLAFVLCPSSLVP